MAILDYKPVDPQWRHFDGSHQKLRAMTFRIFIVAHFFNNILTSKSWLNNFFQHFAIKKWNFAVMGKGQMWIVLLELKNLAHCHHSNKIFELKYLACFQTAFSANHGSIFKTFLSVSMECPVGIKEFRTFNFLTSHTLRGKIKDVELVINFTPSWDQKLR